MTNKLDSVFDLPCECGLCEEDMVFECPGCLLCDIPYCLGQDDDYYSYCTPCWNILAHDEISGPVIQVKEPNVYINS